jgi:hypothetical protein
LETALAMLEGDEQTDGELEDERGRLVRETQNGVTEEGDSSSNVDGPIRNNQLWRTAHTRRARMRSGKTTW